MRTRPWFDLGRIAADLSLVLLFLIPSLAFAAQPAPIISGLGVAICERGSDCLDCVERHVLEVQQDGTRITARGIGSEGQMVAQELRSCRFSANGDWSCSTWVHRIARQEGQMRFMVERQNKGRFEVCEIR